MTSPRRSLAFWPRVGDQATVLEEREDMPSRNMSVEEEAAPHPAQERNSRGYNDGTPTEEGSEPESEAHIYNVAPLASELQLA